MSAVGLEKSWVYLRDDFVPFDQANVSVASSAVLYGLCVYTVLPVTWDADHQQLFAFRLRDHYRRLVNSTKIMDFHNFSRQWPYAKFEQTVLELVRRNNIRHDSLVRVTVFVDELLAGTKMHDLKHNLYAFVYPQAPLFPADGIKAGVSSWRRTSDQAIPSRAKINGSYANASLMKNEALLNGFDEAIAIDEHGHVAEGTVTNLFMVRDGVLITPDPSTDMLEGITRDTIIKLAALADIPVQERSIDRSELYVADELFMCGSSASLVPVLSVDHRTVSDGAGPVTTQLEQLYSQALIDRLPEFAAWTSRV